MTNAWLEQLIESDRLYFEWGARRDVIEHATIAWMPEFRHLAGAAVVHRVRAGDVSQPSKWIAAVESALGDRGIALGRIYLDHESVALEATLEAAGWARRREIAVLAGIVGSRSALRNVRLVRIDDEQWDEKTRLHRECGEMPDGYDPDGDAYVEMERCREAAGPLRFYLAETRDHVVGTVGLALIGGLLRLKNLLVRPADRARGLGHAIVEEALAIASEVRAERAGCFAIEGRARSLYEDCGFRSIGCQIEWSKPLEASR